MKYLPAIAAMVVFVLLLGSVTAAQAETVSYFEDFESAQAALDFTGIVDDGSGSNKVLRASGATNQDIPGVNASEGVIQVSVDLVSHGMDNSEYRYVYFGDTTGFAEANAYFGLRMSGGAVKLTWKDGNGTGGTTEDYYSSVGAANDTWYTFVADVYLTGAKANTWDVKIYDELGTLLASANELGFRTDGSAIDRLGLSYSGGTGDYMQIDNLSIQSVPEPAAFAMLACGGLFLAMATYRRRRRG